VDILLLGGPLFLGRALTDAALSQGHTVTFFNRGRTNPDLYPAVEYPTVKYPTVERIQGDRTQSLAPLADRRWDVVIDTSGYHPTHVIASARALADQVGRYVFISTISVYADLSAPHPDESAPVSRLDDPAAATVSNETYGPLKTHCEDAVVATYGPRSLIIRPGLIVGPHDPTDRYTYWPVRAHRGGEVLAPGAPTAPTQYIDARDLAAWTLAAAAHDRDGIYNATGPAQSHTLGDLLAVCQSVAASPSTLTWVSPEFIAAHNITPFLELPLWIGPALPGLLTVDCSRAISAGLRFRDPAITAADTLTWHTAAGSPALRAGLPPTREAELLTAWHAAQG